MTNQLMAISPYWCDSTNMWVFDDDNYSLVREPFVNGVPEMIEEAVKGIPNAKSGFSLLFSSDPFPNYEIKLSKLNEEYGGWWYVNEIGQQGWLCPAMFNYFVEAPDSIYVQIIPLPDTSK